jgi:hypothetical protein
MRPIPIAVVLVLGCGAAALAQSWEAFPPYPGSRELCHQQVYGSTREIVWAAYTSTDAPQAVTAFYAGKLGKPETDTDGTYFRAAKEGAVERVLSVYPAGGDYPRCGKNPAGDDRTVVIVSRSVAH